MSFVVKLWVIFRLKSFQNFVLTNIAYRQIGLSLSFVYFSVEWHCSAASFPFGDIILAQLACPISDILFCLHGKKVTYLFKTVWLTLALLYIKVSMAVS